MDRRMLLVAPMMVWIGVASAGAVGAQDVVAVVSSKNAIAGLSVNQVADIFLGKINHFPDGTPAMPIDLAEDSMERERFYSQFTGKSLAQVKAHWAKVIFTGRGQPPRQASNASEARRMIADNPNAIGYLDNKSIVPGVKAVATP